MSKRFRQAATCLLLSSVLVPALSFAVLPGDPPPPGQRLPALRAVHDGLEVATSLKLDAERDFSLSARTQPFLQRHGSAWQIRWDERNDRAALVQGSGIPLLPGRGNRLTAGDVVLAGSMEQDLPVVADRARRFLDSMPELLALDGLDLRLDRERSTAYGEGHTHWLLEFQQFHDGIPVDGAYAFVRIAHGNIIQFGSERIADVSVPVTKSSKGTREAVFADAWRQLDFPDGTQVSEWLEEGELRIYPTLPAGESLAQPLRGLRGNGYDHVLAWRFVFRVDEHAVWQVLYDTGSGRVIDLRDLTLHVDAVVKGHVYPTTNLEPSIEVTFPFAAVNNNGAKVTDIDGIYDYSGGTATVTLDGKYFRMADTCGSISLSNSSNGILDLGGNTGTNCATPGSGGAGNTNASRTGFYHLTLINTKARSILPANSWLQTKVTANMNVNQTCNASWGGGQARFFKSGASASQPTTTCGNTGEIAAVFLHEWGHGMDQNTGGAANENGSGEAVGDTFAFLETRDSCIGPGFFTNPGGICYNCTSCSGVRDLADFSLEGTRPIASPANVTADAGLNCDRLACPYLQNGISPYRGPMGYEGHCESYIASTANWDLKNALVSEFGEAGWQRMDNIWYGSLVPSKSAYRVASGGQCNASAAVDGCNSNNWYTVYLAIDDDNGNLADGTPNACRIWDAFNAHGIACGARPACTESGKSGFSLQAKPREAAICAGESADYTISATGVNGFSSPVTLAASGVPAGASAAFSANPVIPDGDSVLTVTTGTGSATGTHTLMVEGEAAGSEDQTLELHLTIAPASPGSPTLLSPENQATGQPLAPLFSWQAVGAAEGYRFELADNAAFSSPLVDIFVTSSSLALDAGVLDFDRDYYWRVSASNSCGTGAESSVYTFRTGVQPGACGSGQLAVDLMREDFSAGMGAFSTVGSTGSSTWAITAAAPAGSPSGGNAVLAVDLHTASDQRLMSPPVTLPPGSAPLTLQFWNHQALEAGIDTCYDAGILEISSDGGGTWTLIDEPEIIHRAYDDPVAGNFGNALAGQPAWCGDRDWENYVVDLAAFAGQTVQFRWRLGTDNSVGAEGWHLDDIRIQACTTLEKDRIFADGFEVPR